MMGVSLYGLLLWLRVDYVSWCEFPFWERIWWMIFPFLEGFSWSKFPFWECLTVGMLMSCFGILNIPAVKKIPTVRMLKISFLGNFLTARMIKKFDSWNVDFLLWKFLIAIVLKNFLFRKFLTAGMFEKFDSWNVDFLKKKFLNSYSAKKFP